MYQYGFSETQDRPAFRQHGDFIKADFCPELPKIHSASCSPYTATEVQVSRSNAGHLTPDVIVFPSGPIPPDKSLVCRYVIIRDFGVDWRHVKPTVTSEPLFQAQRAIFEVNKSLVFRIVGYNDCVGPEEHNRPLRAGRARNVRDLLGPSARSRVMFVGPAPPSTYLFENSTVAGRANNRCVVIEVMTGGGRTARSVRPGPGPAERFGEAGQAGEPVFDLDCPDPPGCPTVAAGQCRAVLRRAIREAIRLAESAAGKIESAIQVEPNSRDEEGKQTASVYKTFFGHDPSHPIPWDGNNASGVSVAKRFRSVAKELAGGRRIVFRCVLDTCAPGVGSRVRAGARPGCCAEQTRAFFVPRDRALRNVVHLCREFWDPPAGELGLSRGISLEAFRGGTIIHEILHLLYPSFLHHDYRRPNAHCYKAFALRVNGNGRDLRATCSCWGMDIENACRQRVGLR